MAIKIIGDSIVGIDTDTYNRNVRVQSLSNGSKNVELVGMKYATEEHRNESPNDGKVFVERIELTEEEYNALWSIFYTAQKRNYEQVEDC